MSIGQAASKKSALALANAARDRGDWGAAAKHYQDHLRSRPDAFAIWVQLGHALKESGRRIEALVAYDRALAIRPDDSDLQLNLGHLHKLLGHREQAISYYRRSVEIDDNPHARVELECISPECLAGLAAPAPRPAHHKPIRPLRIGRRRRREATLGDQARDQGDWRLAGEHYRLHLNENPTDFAIWVQYGHALKEQGDRIGARAAYITAIDLDPLDADVRLQFAHLLKIMGEQEAAIAAYSQAFQLKPSLPGVYFELTNLGVGAAELVRLAVRGPEAPLPEPPSRTRSTVLQLSAPGDKAPLVAARDPSQQQRPWLPGPLGVYWLPQRMRDYLVEQFSHDTASEIEYLMAIIDYAIKGEVNFLRSEIGIDFLERLRRLAPSNVKSNEIGVSIIVPVYNNLIYTLTCIYSVFLYVRDVKFEIIVGDDLSTDETFDICSSISTVVRVLRHEKNLGFLENCNAAARAARGRYVLFLNNDTITLPGWLDRLIETFTHHDGVGFVGSKLINADGSLQEAGGIFWADGSAWNFGRNQNPRLPQFNYFKDVDYCSGASIAMPRELWDRLDGFDSEFAPAYCEDSDIAFRVRQAGYRTVYQPMSELIHHEGKSHGANLSSGVKAYQVVNSQKLLTRWRFELEQNHLPNGQDVYVARDRSRNRPHILFIDHYVPQWDRDAGSRTIYNYVKFFVEQGFQVTFWPDNLNEDREYVRQLQKWGVEVIYSADYVGQFEQWISDNGRWIRYIFSSRPHISKNYLSVIREYCSAKILYYGHDLHWLRMMSEYDITHNEELLSEIQDTKALEDSVMKMADVIMYPSKQECDYARSIAPGIEVAEIPAYIYSQVEIEQARARVSVRGEAPDFGASTILFVGGFAHQPNVDAAIWFMREVEPLIRRRKPNLSVLIAGSNAPGDLRDLERPGIQILGRVSDEALARLHDTSSLTIVPLRYGAGVKGKVIDAMARGLPVVSTDVGMQGIEPSSRYAFVANEPSALADAVVQALDDRSMALAKAYAAVEFIENHYSAGAALSALAAAIPELCANPHAAMT